VTVPSPDRRVVAEFQKRRTRQIFISLSALVPLALMIGMGGLAEAKGISANVTVPVMILCFAAIIAVLVLSFINWRCPACNRYLGKRFFGVRFCDKCGARFE